MVLVMNRIKYLREIFNELSDIQFIILMGILCYCLVIPLVPLSEVYENFFGQIGGPQSLNKMNIFLAFLFAVILGPITESLIIIFIIKILKLKVKKKKSILLGTSIIFSSLHTYSIFYMLAVFIPATIFVYSYMYYECKKKSPFCVMTCIHGIYNLLSLIAMRYF